MRLLISICACLSIFVAAKSFAADTQFPDWPWVHAGRYQPQNGNGITIWINMETMKRAEPHKLRVWVKYENDRPDLHHIKETLVFEQLECDRDWHTTYSLMMYGLNGRLISSSGGNAEQAKSEPIVPDSLLAGIMPFTCAAGGMQH